MNNNPANTAQPIKQFRIMSIERTDPPENVSGGEWYRYTIDHDASPIDGLRSGSYQSVKQHLEEYVANLNARAAYGYSNYAARKAKK